MNVNNATGDAKHVPKTQTVQLVKGHPVILHQGLK